MTKPTKTKLNSMTVRLIQVRKIHGANTPMGHTCSNVVELLPHTIGYVRPDWASHRIQTLPYLLNQQMERLKGTAA